MTPEELLKPRWKVVSDYPANPTRVGDIIAPEGSDLWFKDNVEIYKQFPNIFKPLKWWEERKPEDMPEYVKMRSDGCSIERGGMCEVIEWGRYEDKGKRFGNEGQIYALIEIPEDTKTHDKGERLSINVLHWFPATKEEYETFKTKSK